MEFTQVLLSDSFEEVKATYDKVAVATLDIGGVKHIIYNSINTIGRDDSCDIVIKNNAVSSRHAVVEAEDLNIHHIYDVGSTNKTKLSKATLKPHVRYALNDGDCIMFGNVPALYNVVNQCPRTPEKEETNTVPETPEKEETSVNIVLESSGGDENEGDLSQSDMFGENKCDKSSDQPASSNDAVDGMLKDNAEVDIYELDTLNFEDDEFVSHLKEQGKVEPLYKPATLCVNDPGEVQEESIYDLPTQVFHGKLNQFGTNSHNLVNKDGNHQIDSASSSRETESHNQSIYDILTQKPVSSNTKCVLIDDGYMKNPSDSKDADSSKCFNEIDTNEPASSKFNSATTDKEEVLKNREKDIDVRCVSSNEYGIAGNSNIDMCHANDQTSENKMDVGEKSRHDLKGEEYPLDDDLFIPASQNMDMFRTSSPDKPLLNNSEFDNFTESGDESMCGISTQQFSGSVMPYKNHVSQEKSEEFDIIEPASQPIDGDANLASGLNSTSLKIDETLSSSILSNQLETGTKFVPEDTNESQISSTTVINSSSNNNEINMMSQLENDEPKMESSINVPRGFEVDTQPAKKMEPVDRIIPEISESTQDIDSDHLLGVNGSEKSICKGKTEKEAENQNVTLTQRLFEAEKQHINNIENPFTINRPELSSALDLRDSSKVLHGKLVQESCPRFEGSSSGQNNQLNELLAYPTSLDKTDKNNKTSVDTFTQGFYEAETQPAYNNNMRFDEIECPGLNDFGKPKSTKLISGNKEALNVSLSLFEADTQPSSISVQWVNKSKVGDNYNGDKAGSKSTECASRSEIHEVSYTQGFYEAETQLIPHDFEKASTADNLEMNVCAIVNSLDKASASKKSGNEKATILSDIPDASFCELATQPVPSNDQVIIKKTVNDDSEYYKTTTSREDVHDSKQGCMTGSHKNKQSSGTDFLSETVSSKKTGDEEGLVFSDLPDVSLSELATQPIPEIVQVVNKNTVSNNNEDIKSGECLVKPEGEEMAYTQGFYEADTQHAVHDGEQGCVTQSGDPGFPNETVVSDKTDDFPDVSFSDLATQPVPDSAQVVNKSAISDNNEGCKTASKSAKLVVKSEMDELPFTQGFYEAETQQIVHDKELDNATDNLKSHHCGTSDSLNGTTGCKKTTDSAATISAVQDKASGELATKLVATEFPEIQKSTSQNEVDLPDMLLKVGANANAKKNKNIIDANNDCDVPQVAYNYLKISSPDSARNKHANNGLDSTDSEVPYEAPTQPVECKLMSNLLELVTTNNQFKSGSGESCTLPTTSVEINNIGSNNNAKESPNSSACTPSELDKGDGSGLAHKPMEAEVPVTDQHASEISTKESNKVDICDSSIEPLAKEDILDKPAKVLTHNNKLLVNVVKSAEVEKSSYAEERDTDLMKQKKLLDSKADACGEVTMDLSESLNINGNGLQKAQCVEPFKAAISSSNTTLRDTVDMSISCVNLYEVLTQNAPVVGTNDRKENREELLVTRNPSKEDEEELLGILLEEKGDKVEDSNKSEPNLVGECEKSSKPPKVEEPEKSDSSKVEKHKESNFTEVNKSYESKSTGELMESKSNIEEQHTNSRPAKVEELKESKSAEVEELMKSDLTKEEVHNKSKPALLPSKVVCPLATDKAEENERILQDVEENINMFEIGSLEKSQKGSNQESFTVDPSKNKSLSDPPWSQESSMSFIRSSKRNKKFILNESSDDCSQESIIKFKKKGVNTFPPDTQDSLEENSERNFKSSSDCENDEAQIQNESLKTKSSGEKSSDLVMPSGELGSKLDRVSHRVCIPDMQILVESDSVNFQEEGTVNKDTTVEEKSPRKDMIPYSLKKNTKNSPKKVWGKNSENPSSAPNKKSKVTSNRCSTTRQGRRPTDSLPYVSRGNITLYSQEDMDDLEEQFELIVRSMSPSKLSVVSDSEEDREPIDPDGPSVRRSERKRNAGVRYKPLVDSSLKTHPEIEKKKIKGNNNNQKSSLEGNSQKSSLEGNSQKSSLEGNSQKSSLESNSCSTEKNAELSLAEKLQDQQVNFVGTRKTRSFKRFKKASPPKNDVPFNIVNKNVSNYSSIEKRETRKKPIPPKNEAVQKLEIDSKNQISFENFSCDQNSDTYHKKRISSENSYTQEVEISHKKRSSSECFNDSQNSLTSFDDSLGGELGRGKRKRVKISYDGFVTEDLRKIRKKLSYSPTPSNDCEPIKAGKLIDEKVTVPKKTDCPASSPKIGHTLTQSLSIVLHDINKLPSQPGLSASRISLPRKVIDEDNDDDLILPTVKTRQTPLKLNKIKTVCGPKLEEKNKNSQATANKTTNFSFSDKLDDLFNIWGPADRVKLSRRLPKKTAKVLENEELSGTALKDGKAAFKYSKSKDEEDNNKKNDTRSKVSTVSNERYCTRNVKGHTNIPSSKTQNIPPKHKIIAVTSDSPEEKRTRRKASHSESDSHSEKTLVVTVNSRISTRKRSSESNKTCDETSMNADSCLPAKVAKSKLKDLKNKKAPVSCDLGSSEGTLDKKERSSRIKSNSSAVNNKQSVTCELSSPSACYPENYLMSQEFSFQEKSVKKSLEEQEFKPPPPIRRSSRSKNVEKKPESKNGEKVMFTGLSDKKLTTIVTNLGGELVDSPFTCTVLVTEKVKRTTKFLSALSRGLPIVTPQWLHASNKAGAFSVFEKYFVFDGEAEKKYSFNLKDSLKKAFSKRLLDGWTIFVTSSVKPPPEEVKTIIECSGGRFLAKEPSRWTSTTFVISCQEDEDKWKSLARKGKMPLIVSTEALFSGILQQKLDLETHRLVYK